MDLSCCAVGDFNLPDVNWVDLTYPSNSVHDVVVNCFIKAEFNQVVEFPTTNDAILDLIFTNLLTCYNLAIFTNIVSCTI